MIIPSSSTATWEFAVAAALKVDVAMVSNTWTLGPELMTVESGVLMVVPPPIFQVLTPATEDAR